TEAQGRRHGHAERAEGAAMTACIRCDGRTGAAWRKYCPPCWDAIRAGRGTRVEALPGRPARRAPGPKLPPDPRYCADCGREVPGRRVRCEACAAARKRARRAAREVLAGRTLNDRECSECYRVFSPRQRNHWVCSAE